MVIPRVLSRGSVLSAQKAHFSAILSAAPQLPGGHLQQPILRLRDARRPVLRAAQAARQPRRLQGVRWHRRPPLRRREHHQRRRRRPARHRRQASVFHGYVNCGAVGAITGIGNVLPTEVLHLTNLCVAAARGEAEARSRALELEQAMAMLASFDVGADLVLYSSASARAAQQPRGTRCAFNETDELTPSQRRLRHAPARALDAWYADWSTLPAPVPDLQALRVKGSARARRCSLACATQR